MSFTSASEKLTPQVQTILDGVAHTLKQYSNTRFNVNAHTDSQGSAQYNQNLSAQRAKMVVEYLGQRGINRQNLIPEASGESRPIADNTQKLDVLVIGVLTYKLCVRYENIAVSGVLFNFVRTNG